MVITMNPVPSSTPASLTRSALRVIPPDFIVGCDQPWQCPGDRHAGAGDIHALTTIDQRVATDAYAKPSLGESGTRNPLVPRPRSRHR